eukprot:sb/3475667/
MSSKKSSEESGGGELTVDDIRNITNQQSFENVTYLNLFGANLTDISAIGALSASLEIALLANNRISDISPVLQCSKLVKLDVSSNKITAIPPRELWSGVPELRILYIHDNALNGLPVFSDLAGQ